MTVRRALATRRVGLFLVLACLLVVLGWAFGRSAVALNLETLRRSIPLTYPEMVTLLTAAVGAFVMRPRLWHLERTSRRRAAQLAAGVALLGALAPVMVVLVANFRIPAVYRGDWQFTNAVELGAAVWLLAALLGPALGSGLVALAYFACAITVNAWADLPFVPFGFGPTGAPTANAHWAAAIILLAVAVVVNARTHGLSTFGQRLSGRDE